MKQWSREQVMKGLRELVTEINYLEDLGARLSSQSVPFLLVTFGSNEYALGFSLSPSLENLSYMKKFSSSVSYILKVAVFDTLMLM